MAAKKQIEAWLERMPSWRILHNVPKLPEGVSSIDEWTNKWVAEGNAIEGVEEGLLALLAEEKGEWRRSIIVKALGFVGGKGSVATLIRVLGTDRPLVQRDAAEALGKIGDVEAVEALGKALNTPDDDVRVACCGALAEIGGKKAESFLEKALHDESEYVRDVAKSSLTRLRTGSWPGP